MKTQIKHRYTGEVLFECDVPAGLESELHVRHALEQATRISANLSSANLSYGSKVIGTRPVFSIGPIGSRHDTLMAFGTDQGSCLQTGCFFGPLEQFRKALIAEHDMNKHREEYEAALFLIEKHFSLWGDE